MIFNRTQISRSGVVNLNEFLQRELIDSSAAILPPEKDPTAMGAAITLLVVVALLAVWIPSRRAALVDPLLALRQQ